MGAMPAEQFNSEMRGCLDHADEMRTGGRLLDSQILQGPSAAKSVRVRHGKVTMTDGPFAEAKEVLGGFNIVEADSMEEAVQMALEFPWVRSGCIEVRPVQDMNVLRRTVNAGSAVIALAAALAFSPLSAQATTDWGNLQRYRQANAALAPPKPNEQRVVFMGNSITESWAPLFAQLFPGKPYVGRGISGQTTPQMLVRFRQDVIALKPAVVVILAGTNDIAGNTGPSTLEMIEDNLASMTEIAQANRIRVVLASVLPASAGWP
jgi:hypothetical protein